MFEKSAHIRLHVCIKSSAKFNNMDFYFQFH